MAVALKFNALNRSSYLSHTCYYCIILVCLCSTLCLTLHMLHCVRKQMKDGMTAIRKDSMQRVSAFDGARMIFSTNSHSQADRCAL